MQQNQKINVASYSSYVKFMGKSLSCVDAVEMYRDIKDRSIKYNVSVCNAFLSSLIKKGKSESSLKLFTQMKRDGLVPDVFTYSTVRCFQIEIIPTSSSYSHLVMLNRVVESKNWQ